MIAPGGGISLDGTTWVHGRPNFLLSVRVLSRLFRRLFIEKLVAAHQGGRLAFFGTHASLASLAAFRAYLAPPRKQEWVVHAKPPFGGPEAVLAYLARYTHRIAISNSRIRAIENGAVTFACKDYRRDGAARYGTMTLDAHEFIRRFLMHVLPKGFHRIRHYGLFANGNRAANIKRARDLLAVPPAADTDAAPEPAEEQCQAIRHCPSCGGPMSVVETFEPGCPPKYQPPTEAIDSS